MAAPHLDPPYLEPARLEPAGLDAQAPTGLRCEASAGRAESLELARLYEEHFAFVWRSLRALGIAESVLDDAAQDVFLVAHRRSHEFQGRSSVKTWLFGIAFRVASNWRRAVKRRPTAELPAELTCTRPSPHEHAERAEAVRFVEDFLSSIDDAQRAAFTACVLEEMSVPEAAEALGINVNTLYSRVRVVRSKFLAAMKARGPRS